MQSIHYYVHMAFVALLSTRNELCVMSRVLVHVPTRPPAQQWTHSIVQHSNDYHSFYFSLALVICIFFARVIISLHNCGSSYRQRALLHYIIVAG